jgi:hypothetical protein
VREHSGDTLDALVGRYELHDVRDGEGMWQRKRFDPVRLAKYMTSEYGTWRNNDDIVGALRAADLPADDLMGESFYANTIRDRLIRFDEASAVSLGLIETRSCAMGRSGTIECNGAS